MVYRFHFTHFSPKSQACSARFVIPFSKWHNIPEASPPGHGRGFRRSTVSWPPLRGGCLPARADWGSVLPPEVTSWLLRVKAPLCRGSLFSVPSAPAAIFPLNNSCQAGGACRRPYIHRRYCVPPLIRHGLRHATFPQGKAILRIAGRFSGSRRLRPLSHGVAVTA